MTSRNGCQTKGLLFGRVFLPLALALLPAGCASRHGSPSAGSSQSLAAARTGFTTHLTAHKKTPDPVPVPPSGFELVSYAAPLGAFPAYVATVPSGGTRHPAIVWVAGGFDNSIGNTPWAEASPDNDQSARAFYQSGIVTLYPSLRGGNNNPGVIEGLYGEVDDVLAAGKYLASRPDVDPKRVYLGGHSTGGTLALLCAESSPQFRAVFAFGPIAQIEDYGSENLPFDTSDSRETDLRSPVLYLGAITSPTFVFEGTESGNSGPERDLYNACRNPKVHFYRLPGADHFSELAPTTPVIAAKIMADTGPEPQLKFVSQNPSIQPMDP